MKGSSFDFQELNEQIEAVPSLSDSLDNLFTNQFERYNNMPILKQFFHGITQEQYAVIAGEPKTGKSTFAFMLANAIATGNDVFEAFENINIDDDDTEADPINLQNQIEPQKVMFVDYELTPRQIKKRLGNDLEKFLKNVTYLNETDCYKKTHKVLNYELIKEAVIKFNINVLFIDNITAYIQKLGNGKTSQDGGTLTKVLDDFKQLANELNVFIVFITHTNKRYADPKGKMKPLEATDIQGHGNLSNLANCVLMLGRSSKGNDISYLKFVLLRDAPKPEKVITMKRRGNPLKFEFLAWHNEEEHYKTENTKRTKAIIKTISNIFNQNPNTGFNRKTLAVALHEETGTLTTYSYENKITDLLHNGYLSKNTMSRHFELTPEAIEFLNKGEP